jgi:hypothetical protein
MFKRFLRNVFFKLYSKQKIIYKYGLLEQPDSILAIIISLLDFKSLIKCESSCKTLYRIIESRVWNKYEKSFFDEQLLDRKQKKIQLYLSNEIIQKIPKTVTEWIETINSMCPLDIYSNEKEESINLQIVGLKPIKEKGRWNFTICYKSRKVLEKYEHDVKIDLIFNCFMRLDPTMTFGEFIKKNDLMLYDTQLKHYDRVLYNNSIISNKKLIETKAKYFYSYKIVKKIK